METCNGNMLLVNETIIMVDGNMLLVDDTILLINDKYAIG